MIHICTHGKFTTASRKNAGVVVSGNSVYVSENSFKQYANYKNFWIFSNDNGMGNSVSNANSNVSYIRYVATKSSNLNVRSSPNGTRINSLKKGTQVTVTTVSGDWSKINSPIPGWVSTSYLSSSVVLGNSNTTPSTKYTTGTYKVTASLLHVRTGPGKNYKIKTYSQLTSNARAQNKDLGNYYYNGYRKGVICTVIEIRGNWGKTASGWICLDYCKK